MDDDSTVVLDSMITTTFALDGYTVERNIGIVTRFTNLCEEARVHARGPAR